MPQYPFMYPGVYSPGQMAFNNNAELSQLISMFSGPLLGQMAGPGNFMPHMMPTQQLVDQFALRNYQDQTRASAFQIAHDNTPGVAGRLLGLRSAFTDAPATELNREQASNMAGIINNPFMKAALGQIIGPENMESMLHGRKGDVSALGSTINRVGYFRHDPTGSGRMDAASLTDFSRGMYAHMYEPQGNLEEIETQARDTDAAVRTAGRTRLKKAAKRENVEIVDDADVATRLETMEDAPKQVEALYKKYVADGKATDTKQQAQELVKFERAIAAAGVLKENEMTVGGLRQKAERAPVDEMHGFMAGQVGQITENMFQRGMLPQAIGAMTPSERARLVNQTPLDAETETRLSRELARRDLEDKTNASDKARQYRGLTTDRERNRFIDENVEDYRVELKKTRDEVEKTATGAVGAMNATDLEKLKGFDSLAGNVDAKRSAEAIKKYTGAVAAVRDIFGDNGNPNAPLPALLAALEGLTGGAVGSMKPQKIEATLRQMQTLAKEAGIGFEQMAAMSTQIDGMGQAMGLTPADTLRIKGGAMAAAKVMQDTGAFSNPIYGQVDKGTATAQTAELITRGAGSRNAAAMAALESIYQADPSRFADSDMERALVAYRDNEGDGTYTTKSGEVRNIREEIGRHGQAGAINLLTQAGGTRNEYNAQINNPAAKQFSNPMFAFLTQKYEALRDINYGDTQGRVLSKLEKNSTLLDGKDQEGRARFGAQLGDVVAKMIVDSSGLETDEQITYIQENMEAEFAKEFEKTMPPDQAAAKAKEAASAMSSRSSINEFIGGANTVFAAKTGRMLSNDYQHRGNGRDAKTAQEYAQSAVRAQRRAETGMGFESPATAEISDYLLSLHEKGEKFNADEFIKAGLRVTSDREILNRYAHDMEGGFNVIGDLRKKALITRSDVEGMKGDTAGLKKLAGVADDIEIVSNEKTAELRDAKINELAKDNKAVARAYKEYVSGSAAIDPEKMTDKDRANFVAELRANERFMADTELDVLGSKRMSQKTLDTKVGLQIGSAKDGQKQQAVDIAKIEKAMLEGSNPEVLREGVFATLRALNVNLDETQTNELRTAISDTSEQGGKKLKAALDSLSKTGAISGQQETQLREVSNALQKGIPLQLGKTLGIDKITDKEMTRELAAVFAETQNLTPAEAEKKAKAAVETVTKQREEAAKKSETASGKPATTAEARVETQRQLEATLQKEYEQDPALTAEDAKKKAQETAAAVMQRTSDAVAEKSAGGVQQQRVDTLEVNAQTVVIKGGKVDGADSVTGGTGVADLLPAGLDVGAIGDMLPSGVDAKMAGGLLQAVTGGGVGDLLTSVAGMGVAAINGQTPKTPETPKEDAAIAPPAPAPQPAAPEPEKVQQANEAQMKQDAGITPPPTEEQKMYTADELAALHPEGVKDEFGETQPWEPPLSQRLPTGNYERKNGGNYVNTETGQEYDRYGNPAGGVYSADGHKWSASAPAEQVTSEEKQGEAQRPAQPSANVKKDEQTTVQQNNEEEFKRKSGVPAATSTPQKDPNAPNREQLRLQNVYADKLDRLAAATSDYDRRDAEQDIQTSFEQMGKHNAAREAGIDTSRGLDYDVHAGTINGKAVSPESVARHIKLLKEQAAKDPKSLLTDEIRERRYGEKPKAAAVTAKNEEELKRANGLSSANVTPEQAAAQTAAPSPPASPENKTARLTPEAAAGAAVPSAEIGAADTLASALPEAKPPASSVSAVSRVQSLSANMPVGPAAAAPGGGASAAGGGGSSGGSMTINGTLALSGLQEAILSAQGSRVMQTEGGAPVVIDPTMQQGTPSAPKTYA